MEKKLKHLDFIQQAISRMASNLFLLKGWTITLIAALFALAAKDSNKDYFFIAYIPAVMFWALDGYFLAMERRFRSLYDHVRKLEDHEIDFSLNPTKFSEERGNSWVSAMFSRTIFWYYGAILVSMGIVNYFLTRSAGS